MLNEIKNIIEFMWGNYMKLFMFPADNLNDYIKMLINNLEKNGVEIIDKDIHGKVKKLWASFTAVYFKQTKIVHLNWIENYALNHKLKSRIKCWLVILWIDVLKFGSAKIVWTMHNRKPHDCTDDNFAKEIYKKLSDRVDLIVVHCEESETTLIEQYAFPKSKILNVPHGAYRKCISDEVVWKKKEEFKDNKMVLMSFGTVSRYKNVPMLIRAFREINNDEAILVICGKIDENEKKIIVELSEGCRDIIIDDRFIPDEEIYSIFKYCDLVVLPYIKESMYNSGVAILAFTYGKPILVSEFGFVKSIADKDFVFIYDYKNEKEHFEILKVQLKKQIESHKMNPQLLSELGEHANIYATEELNWESICRKIYEAYQRL